MLNFLRRYMARQEVISETDVSMSKYCRCSPKLAHVAFTDGQNMYIYGGYYGNQGIHIDATPDELMVYSSSLDLWSSKKCDGDIPKPSLSGASCSVIFPYAYFIAGFQNGIGHTSAVYQMDLRTLVWKKLPVDSHHYPSPRDKFTSWVYQDKIYCFGGWGRDPHYGGLDHNGDFVPGAYEWDILGWNNQLLIFDPGNAVWENPSCKGPVPSARAAHSAALISNCAYVFGGRHGDTRLNDIHVLNLDTLSWSGQILPASDSQPVGRSWHSASVVSDHEIFIFGGYDQLEAVLGDGWIFDTSTNTWRQIIQHSSNRRLWHSAVVTSNNNVLIYGGCSDSIKKEDLTVTDYSDQVIQFQFQPYSLLRLCVDFVAEHSRRSRWLDMCEPLRGWLRKKQAVLSQLTQLKYSLGNSFTPHFVNGFVNTAQPAGAGDSHSQA